MSYSPFDLEPGQLVLLETAQMEYGVARDRLNSKLVNGGLLAGPDANLSDVRAPVLMVDSVPDALRALVTHLRDSTDTTAVAVTGSVGKTSSCHLLRHLLSRHGSVRSNGQRNFHDGVLCEAANLGTSDFLVIEVSLQALLKGATSTVKPHVALLTHVTPVHMDLHGGLIDLTERKAALLADLPVGGTAVINRDLEHFETACNIAHTRDARIVTFGENGSSDFQLLDYDSASGTVTARLGHEQVCYHLGLPGRHMALNSLGVLAAAQATGVAVESIIADCATALPAMGRSRVEKLRVCGRQITLVDDSYNASPASMRAAFELLASLQPGPGGRRIAVLGDMLELGSESRAQHEALAQPLLDAGVQEILLCGDEIHALYGCLARSSCSVRWFRSPQEMLEPLARGLSEGDVVLFKGSHGSHVREVAALLRLLSLVPTFQPRLQQQSVSTFLLLHHALEWAQSRAPARVRRWVNWQIHKLGGLV